MDRWTLNTQVPDVTVIVAVYNTMPYLTTCLESVFGQTIGVERLEVVAVDDGSTDDSGAELSRWAERHPGSMTVLTQANSGGPAGPSNRALDLARGRYVFFLGADDYLGAEALQRLVDTADELSADVVLGRLVGTGGRNVNQAVYQGGNRDDITLVNSALPWALSLHPSAGRFTGWGAPSGRSSCPSILEDETPRGRQASTWSVRGDGRESRSRAAS